MTRLLVVIGWLATAVAAYFFGVIMEHAEGHEDGLWREPS